MFLFNSSIFYCMSRMESSVEIPRKEYHRCWDQSRIVVTIVIINTHTHTRTHTHTTILFVVFQLLIFRIFVCTLLARRCIQRSALGTEHSSRHFRLSVRRCELWPHTWMDRDAVCGGELGRARKRCIRFWWWSSKGKGQFGVNLQRPIVTNGDFDASLCESA